MSAWAIAYTVAWWLLVLAMVYYAGHIILFTAGWFRLERFHSEKGYHQSVSVSLVIPFRNESGIADKLRAYAEMMKERVESAYPTATFTETIGVDDHSEGEFRSEVEAFLDSNTLDSIRILRLADLGVPGSKKSAVTEGVKAARGQLILVTDADCNAGRGWITELLSYYEQTRKQLIAGPVRLAEGKGFGFQHLEFLGLVGAGAGAIGAGKPIYCNGANMAFSREAFLAVDGYRGNENYRSGDDVFLMHKIKKHYSADSIGFIKSRDAVVTAAPAAGLRAFLLQRIRWGSKSKGYRDPMAISTALSVGLFNGMLALWLAGTGITFLSGSRVSFIPLAALLVKTVIDLPLMIAITGFMKQRKLLRAYPLYQLVYPFYILAAVLGSLFISPDWKGRK